MTRINVIPVRDLCDEHLVCEEHEIIRVPQLIIDLSNRGKRIGDIDLPGPEAKYVLGEGHVRFFYDKMYYLSQRHMQLQAECFARGLPTKAVWPDVVFPDRLWFDYEPTKEAILINLRRLTEKFTEKFRPTYSPHIYFREEP